MKLNRTQNTKRYGRKKEEMRDINNLGKDVRNNAKQDNVRKGESREDRRRDEDCKDRDQK